MNRLPKIAVVVAALAALVGGSPAGEPEAKGPLADRPSKPGAHLEKVKALGDNAWLNLGKPAPDPKYGAAQGRSWSRKMAYAPDLRGAFIFGSGVHHGTTMRGGRKYFNDDVFFYDINAHAWVCAHPGTPLAADGSIDAEIKVDPATGLNVDKDGQVIPVASSVHAYWTPEYDTDLKMFMFVPSTDPFGFLSYDKQTQKYSTPPNYSSPWESKYSPYYYDGRTGKFERRAAPPGHARPGCDTALFYSAKQKKAVYLNGGVWLYDHAANTWKRVAEGGAGGANCYDSKRDVVYTVTGQFKRDDKGNMIPAGPNTNVFKIYEIGANKWTTPESPGDVGECAASHLTFFTYDTVNDVAVLYTDKHNVYDPSKSKWTAQPQTLTTKIDWSASSGFYDPETNAHFYFNAGDSSTDPGNMWAWRYARGGSR
jgi:hypothetical protein